MRVLVVDDKAPIIDRVKELLAPFAHQVDCACNGLDALEKAQKSPYDLFIIDHLMPVMNGLQLVKNLKGKSHTRTTPLLFMTTQDTSALKSLPESALFDGLIAKPIDENVFYSIINELFPQNTRLRSL